MDKGLDYKFMPMLMELLDLSAEDMSGHIEVSMRTLHERKNTRHFNKRESERLVRLARLFLKALKVFETPAFAQEWLKSPKPALGGRTPLDFARTEVGAREVEDLLGRIEHGVFS
jgi:putative toxin-antitoxin system antitoxin component (TIGR02293 family)